jgi:hypothetical protein
MASSLGHSLGRVRAAGGVWTHSASRLLNHCHQQKAKWEQALSIATDFWTAGIPSARSGSCESTRPGLYGWFRKGIDSRSPLSGRSLSGRKRHLSFALACANYYDRWRCGNEQDRLRTGE